MTDRKLVLSVKQRQAWRVLNDRTTTEILYGGAAGGGKTFLGCAWIISSCCKYPGTRYMIGRARLTALKQSTMLTLFDLLKKWGFVSGKDYNYNAMSNFIRFVNGSEIYFKDLFLYPTDPEFDSLGSTEFTYVFIDEASQITNKAKQIVTSRIRYKHREYNIIPKLFIASNPSKTFLYSDFYKPSKNGTLPKYRKFIRAVVQENPFMPEQYIHQLQRLDELSKQRLLYGNWEYDDDPAKLFEYDDIVDLFHLRPEGSEKYMSVDVARFGKDKTVIFCWRGLFAYKCYTIDMSSVEDTKNKIIELSRTENIPRSQIIIDEDGVGGGVVDGLEGVKGFVNNAKAFIIKYKEETANYSNLKTQCYFMLAKLTKEKKIGIETDDIKIKEKIIEDLEQVKQKDIDKDQRIRIIGKEEIKENIGRSPDYGDALMMRMFFELTPKFDYYVADVF